jgi:putative transposase
VRDAIVDFYRQWSERMPLTIEQYCGWLGVRRARMREWVNRYGMANEHNGLVNRDHWISRDERKRIIDFHHRFPLNGYRRLSFMMMDQDVVHVSPTTVYNVLKHAGLIDAKKSKKSKKGTGFVQPLKPHDHWHIDVSHINIGGTFYYLCSILDGYSRSILHWDMRESMKEREIEVIVQACLEKFPGFKPRIISDNGPQFIAKEFKSFVRECQISHVRTSPYYPQSNGKLERWHASLKGECIRPLSPESADEARGMIARYIQDYNHVRLHAALGYVTPQTKLEGKEQEVFAERDRKLETARRKREIARANEAAANAGLAIFTSVDAFDRVKDVMNEDKAMRGRNLSAFMKLSRHASQGNAINPGSTRAEPSY